MKEFLKLQPIGRLGLPEEIAHAVLWLCSPAASFVLGVALQVNGASSPEPRRQVHIWLASMTRFNARDDWRRLG